ncbi:hypothetical protein CHUAL_006887 [Chamberlinius hualienensis]
MADINLDVVEFHRSRLRKTGWYFGEVNWLHAIKLLRSEPVGTFLIRDSGDPNYLFTITLQTSTGTTSIRIFYADGLFRLDCDNLTADLLPKFDCVTKLVNHYIELSKKKGPEPPVSKVDGLGQQIREIILVKPFSRVKSLKHYCLMLVMQLVPVEKWQELGLPQTLLEVN